MPWEKGVLYPLFTVEWVTNIYYKDCQIVSVSGILVEYMSEGRKDIDSGERTHFPNLRSVDGKIRNFVLFVFFPQFQPFIKFIPETLRGTQDFGLFGQAYWVHCSLAGVSHVQEQLQGKAGSSYCVLSTAVNGPSLDQSLRWEEDSGQIDSY